MERPPLTAAPVGSSPFVLFVATAEHRPQRGREVTVKRTDFAAAVHLARNASGARFHVPSSKDLSLRGSGSHPLNRLDLDRPGARRCNECPHPPAHAGPSLSSSAA